MSFYTVYPIGKNGLEKYQYTYRNYFNNSDMTDALFEHRQRLLCINRNVAPKYHSVKCPHCNGTYFNKYCKFTFHKLSPMWMSVVDSMRQQGRFRQIKIIERAFDIEVLHFMNSTTCILGHTEIDFEFAKQYKESDPKNYSTIDLARLHKLASTSMKSYDYTEDESIDDEFIEELPTHLSELFDVMGSMYVFDTNERIDDLD